MADYNETWFESHAIEYHIDTVVFKYLSPMILGLIPGGGRDLNWFWG
jgi:hypothetical protein